MFDLAKFLRGVGAQINPWDNGADFNSVMHAKKKQQTPQPQQSQAIPIYSRPQAQASQAGIPLQVAPVQHTQALQLQNPYHQQSVSAAPQQQADPWNPAQLFNNVVNAGKSVISGIEQNVGNLADVAIQGGGLLDEAANQMQGGTDAQKNARMQQNLANSQKLRDVVHGASDLSGDKITGTQNVDQAASRIASGHGSGQDIAAVAGKGLETGLGATMFANPSSLAAGSLRNAGIRQTLQTAGRDALLYGGTGGATAGLESYGQNGDVGQAFGDALKSGLQTGLTQGAFDIGGRIAGPVMRNAANKTEQVATDAVNNARPSVMAAQHPAVLAHDDQYGQLSTAFDNTQDPIARRQISQAMADNRQARLATKRQVERQLTQGGYIKNPLSDNQQPLPFNTNEPVKATPAPAPVIPKVAEPQIAAQPKPQMVSLPPEQRLATQDGGGQIMRNGEVATQLPQKETRYASQTIPKSEYVGEQVSAQTKKNAPTYTPETERGRYSQTLKSADQKGFTNFEHDVHDRLQQQHIDSQTVADAQAVAQRLEFKGDNQSLRRASEIYDKLSEHLTKAGQTVQAAAIMARRTPRGMKFHALNDLKKSGVEITPELQRAIDQKISTVTKTKPNTLARTKAVAEFSKEVTKHIPQSTVSNAVSVWKAGLLSGVKTTQGNILSNSTFAVLKKASDPVTTAADEAMSWFTGKHSTSLTQRGTLSGTKEGLQNAAYTMKTGIDLRNASDKYENRQGINFKNKTVQKVLGGPAQTVFNFMGAQDQPFYYSQLKNSLYDLATVEGANKGLNGKTLHDFVDRTVQNPTDGMMQRATDEASKSVLGYDTVAYKAIQSAKQGIERAPVPEIWKKTGMATLDVLAPFTRVPTAFLSRSIDFSPLGVPKELLTQISNKTFDQRSLSKAIGEGVTGTGLLVLGAALSNSGQLSGDYPSDTKEQQRWKAEGIQPNSVKLGGKWVSLNYLGPVGMLFGASKKFVDSSKEGSDKLTATATAIGGFGQTLLGQSFLQGISGFMDAVKDPKRYAENFSKSQTGSIVPSIINDFANLTDGFQREANTPLEALMNRVPGLRENLNKKQDVYGNKLVQNGPDTLNALKPSGQPMNDVKNEVSRLHSVDPNNSDLQITPTQVDKAIKVNGQSIKLNDNQRYDLQSQIGQATQKAWGDLIQTDAYKKLSDIEKAKKLNDARTGITDITQNDFIAQNNLGAGKKLTNREKQLAANGDISSYTSTSGGSSVNINDKISSGSKDILTKYSAMDTKQRKQWMSSENDAEYKYYKAKYENDKASGSLTKIQDLRTRKMLQKDYIGSKYSKEARDAHALSKADVTDYIGTTKNPDKTAQELYNYDTQLYNSGLQKYRKFKNGLTYAVHTNATASNELASTAESTAKKYGIPSNLFAALINQESGGNQAARSPVGAIGLTQLMPATAKGLGVNPNDPKQNLEGGAKYLAAQYKRFGRWDLALAAYNAGPGAVQSAGGVPGIPETQNYVRSILSAAGSKGATLASLISHGGTVYKTIGANGKVTLSATPPSSSRSGGRRSSGGRKKASFKLPSTSVANSAAKDTYSTLERLLAGTTAKTSQPKQIGRKVALKKIVVKA